MAASLYLPSPKKLALQRWQGLKTERTSYDAHYRLLAQNVLPRASRFVATDRNQKGGLSISNSIIDNTATRALRTLAAGMMSGMTSPSRPWFMLRTPDDDLNKNHNVRQWLQQVTNLMLRIFAKSNTYNALHTIYQELGLFGTACNFVSPNFDNVIHHYTATAGEYALATDNTGMVDTAFREFEITINQAVKWFGRDALTTQRQIAYDTHKGDEAFTIIHAIEPRLERDATKRDGKNMPFRSLYMEVGGDENTLLQEGGFKTFPGLCPRWDIVSNDTYGSSPGMDALGDTMALQQMQYRKAEAIDYKARPPIQVPTAMKDADADFLPGGVSYYDAAVPNAGIRTAFEVNLDINELQGEIQDTRSRINSGFYADVFLAITQADDPHMTATEVSERKSEKLLMLGPVLERLQNELLSPLIESCFARIVEAGLLPPPPTEMHGKTVQAEYISILAQAQKAIGVNSVDRFIANLGSIAAIKPGILDRFDEDAWVDYYSDTLGVDASLIVSTQQATLIRAQRAQQQQAQAKLAAANSAADTAQKAAGAAQSATAAGIPLPQGAGYTIGQTGPRDGGAGIPTQLGGGNGAGL